MGPDGEVEVLEREVERANREDRFADLVALSARLEPLLDPNGVDRGELLARRAKALRHLGRPVQAVEAAQEAVRLLEASGGPVLADSLQELALSSGRDLRRLLRRAIRVADDCADDARRHRLRTLLAAKIHLAGDRRGAVALLDEAEPIPPGDRDAWYCLTRGLVSRGTPESGRWYARALEAARAEGWAPYAAQALVGLGAAAAAEDRADEALASYRAALAELGTTTVGHRERYTALSQIAVLCVARERRDEAEAALRETLRLTEAVGAVDLLQAARFHLGMTLVLFGRYDEAETLFRAVDATVALPEALLGTSLGLAACAAARGDAEAFDRWFLPFVTRFDSADDTPQIWLAEATAALAQRGGKRWLLRSTRARRLTWWYATRVGIRDEIRSSERALRRLADQGAPVPIGPFVLQERVGAGAFGEVWSATHDSGTRVALKFVKRSGPPGTSIDDELRAVAALDHPNVVRLIHHGRVDGAAAAMDGRLAGAAWLAMPFSPGGNLGRHLGTLRWSAVRRILLALLDALAHAHARGLLHLDVKPENLLLDGDPATSAVRLADFGLAGTSGAVASSAGTPLYMAPERFVPDLGPVGPWTDLYAVGCLAVALASGAPPFRGSSLGGVRLAHLGGAPEIDPRIAVPEGFEAWVRRALARDPAQRFRRAADAGRALLALGPAGDDPAPAGEVAEEVLTTVVLPPPDDDACRVVLAPDDRVCPVPPVAVPHHWSRAPIPPAPMLVEAELALFGLRGCPVVGRETERDTLWDALREVHATGAPRVVPIVSSPGCGGSTLAAWLCERAHEVGAAELVAAGLSRLPDDLEAAIREAAEARPVVVWLDGADCGPDVAARVVALARSASPVLLLVACHGGDGVGALGVPPLRVGPLPEEHQRTLLQGLLAMEPDTLDVLATATAGSPAFAVQLVTDLVLRERFVATPTGHALQAAERDVLPPSIEELWRRSLRDVHRGDPARADALALFALAEPVPSAVAWAETCARAGLEATPVLAELLSARLAVRRPWGFVLADPRLAAPLIEDARERERLDELRALWLG